MPPRPYSRLTKEALTLLGAQVRLARKRRRMTEMELAERAGIARSTLQLIEKGDPRVEIGLVFEAATLAVTCSRRTPPASRLRSNGLKTSWRSCLTRSGGPRER